METKETALVQQPAAPATAIMVPPNYTAQVAQATAMREAVMQTMRGLMEDGIHYGVMPGTEAKLDKKGNPIPPRKCLFKAGAETLCSVFRLLPEYEVVTRIEEPTFLHFEVRCTIKHISTGEILATGMGSANTREDRYYNQCTQKVCPHCKKPTVFRSRRPPSIYFCWDAKGGCGAEFVEQDRERLEQAATLTEQKVWALHNTIIQQSHKRAMVAAVRTATACSDIFTQDMMPDPTADEEHDDPDPRQQGRQQQAPKTQQSSPPTTSTAKETKGQAPSGPALALPTEVRDLNWALRDSKICAVGLDKLPAAERQAKEIENRLRWANLMLQERGLDAIDSFSKLTSERAQEFIKAAKDKYVPEGWS